MILALCGAVAIGLALGLLGSGGSILTVPILVYLVGEPEKVAIAGSLAIVGVVALMGALPWMLRRTVDWRQVLFFGGPGMLGTIAGATFARRIPGVVQLSIFGVVMLVAAVMTFRQRAGESEVRHPGRVDRMAAQGFAIGVLTGVVGVGGGFLILPALMVFGGLTMYRALGTSLTIIAMNAFSGFARHATLLASLGLSLDWHVIGTFAVVGAGGSLAGQRIASRIPQDRLRRLFGVFLVVMSLFILGHNAHRLINAMQ